MTVSSDNYSDSGVDNDSDYTSEDESIVDSDNLPANMLVGIALMQENHRGQSRHSKRQGVVVNTCVPSPAYGGQVLLELICEAVEIMGNSHTEGECESYIAALKESGAVLGCVQFHFNSALPIPSA